MEFDLNDLANAYLQNYRSQNKEEHFWAWEEVTRIVQGADLNRAWEITLQLLRKAHTDDELGYVAAGPLEDMVDGYGDRALDRLEGACDTDSRLQFALSGIWLLPDSPVLKRWQGLMTKYGFRNGKRQPLSYHADCW